MLRISKFTTALFLILAAGILLRILPICSKGLFVTDAGTYANEGKFVYYSLQLLVKNNLNIKKLMLNLTESKNYIMDRGGSFPDTGKPFFAVLVGVCYAIFGVHDWSFLLAPAMSSVFTLCLVGLIAYRFYGPVASLISMSVLSISKWSVLFSHLGYAESSSTFFAFAALCLYIISHTHKRQYVLLSLSGLLAAAALLMNYKAASVPVIVVLSELLDGVVFRNKERSLIAIRISVFFASCAVLIGLIEAGHLVIQQLVPGSFFADGKAPSYLEQFFAHAITVTPGKGKYDPTIFGIPEFFKQYASFEGIHMVAISLGALFVIGFHLKRHYSTPDLIFWLYCFVHLVIWSITTGNHPSPKPFQLALPSFAVLIGSAAQVLMTNNSYKSVMPKIVFCVFSFVFMYGVINSVSITRYKSGYRSACYRLGGYMTRHGGVVTGNQGSCESIIRFYLGNMFEEQPELRDTIDLRTRDKMGDFVFIDFSRYTKPEKHKKFVELTESLLPIIVQNNQYVAYQKYLASGDIQSNIIALQQEHGDYGLIKIYDLRKHDERQVLFTDE